MIYSKQILQVRNQTVAHVVLGLREHVIRTD